RCLAEKGTLVFEVAKKPPDTLAALIKKIVKQETGLTYPVEVRVALDSAEADQTEEAGDTRTSEEKEVAQDSKGQDEAAPPIPPGRQPAVEPTAPPTPATQADAAVQTPATGPLTVPRP